jgi:lipoprotein NlpD
MKVLRYVRYALLVSAPLWLVACASHAPVPTIERAPVAIEKPVRAAEPAGVPATEGPLYAVKKGDTLYSIALDHGHDPKDIAAWNNLENPDRIKIGQQLRLSPPGSEGAPVAVVKPIAGPAVVEVKPVSSKPMVESNTATLKREPKGGKVVYSEAALAKAREGGMPAKPVETPPVPQTVEAKSAAEPAAVVASAIDWAWPTNGKLISTFVEGSNKGIDIAAAQGDPVLAAAPGKVVYSGTGLRGYGKLVIVRHNAEFLSAYAHNSQILVKEGDAVAHRQKIAEVGSTDAESPRLHFEIRRQGKPADPLKFLPAR